MYLVNNLQEWHKGFGMEVVFKGAGATGNLRPLVTG